MIDDGDDDEESMSVNPGSGLNDLFLEDVDVGADEMIGREFKDAKTSHIF